MRFKIAPPLTASALLSLSLLAGCALGDAQDPAALPQESDYEVESHTDPFEKKSVTLSTGITMKYVEIGPWWGEPVILLHGFTDTSRSFFPTIQAFLDMNTDLHVFALDQRGHGASSMPSTTACRSTPEDCFEMTDLAADVISFMNKKNISRAHIVGHSMGSLVAQELALAYPSRLKSIMLIGTFVDGINSGAIQFFLNPLIEGDWRAALEQQRPGFVWPRDAYLLTPPDVDPNVNDFLAAVWVVDPTADPAFLASVLPETSATKLGTWIGANRNFSSFDSRTRLAQLSTRTLVIWGTQDNFFPDPEQITVRAALDAAVNACRTHYYYKTYGVQPLPASGFQETDIGHNIQFGAGEAIALEITSWVEDREPTPDLPYADPTNTQNILIDPGAAQIIERRPPASCN
jgi:non-heme chloroperoxidase